MPKLAVAGLALVAAALLRPGAVRATTADDICAPTATACVLDHDLTVSPGSTLDFGGREFAIKAPDGRLEIVAGDTLSISAGSMVVETGPGGRIRSALASEGGCRIEIRVGGTFAVTRVPGPSSIAIDVSSYADACSLDIDADGDVTIGGEIQANGIGNDSAGGDLFIGSGGGITIADRVLVDAPNFAGAVELQAKGPITLTEQGDIDASGAVGGGSIALTTDRDLVNAGTLEVKGRFSEAYGCDGGFLVLTALGDIDVNGPILGEGELEDCSGGTLDMLAGGSILVNAPIDFSGGPNGQGGSLEGVEAGRDFLQMAPILVSAGGLRGWGGDDVNIVAGRRLLVGDLLDLSGGPQINLVEGSGRSGNLSLTAGESLEIAGEIAADGADFGSLLFTTADGGTDILGRILVTGEVHALSSADEDSSADVRFEACDIEVTGAGRVTKAGPASRNLLRASGKMRIAGTLDAGSGTNELQYHDPTRPPLIVPGAVVTPAPVVSATPAEPLRPCACTLDPGVAGVLCDDANVCTREACDPTLGCTSTPLSGEGVAGCDDGNACDGRETCEALACRPGPIPVADDGDPCTDDGVCDPVNGYPRTPRTGFGAAICRMDRIDTALAAASVPGDVSAKSLVKIRKLARRVRATVEKAAGAGRKRRRQLLAAAAKKLQRLDQVITSPKTSITSELAQTLTATTSELRGALTAL